MDFGRESVVHADRGDCFSFCSPPLCKPGSAALGTSTIRTTGFRQFSPTDTDTLVINDGRARADALTISNPNIRLGSSTSTPILALNDTTLSDTNSIRVETTTFDPSEADLHARIRVVGDVTDNGTIDVGTAGVEVKPTISSPPNSKSRTRWYASR